MSTHLVCSKPNIWVFDGLLSDRLLDHIDNLFDSQEVHEYHEQEGWFGKVRNSRNLAVDIDHASQELVDVLQSISHVHHVEECRKVLIADVWGNSQDPHMDHINVDELAYTYDKLDFLDLQKQSISKNNDRKVVPTFSIVVYFSHVGGVRFPKAEMACDTIAGKRGRIIMFQNYLDSQRPEHNSLATHYGLYFDDLPKRVMTAGILANETPLIEDAHTAGSNIQGLLYCPGLKDEGVRHDNPSYGWSHHADDAPAPRPKTPKPKPDMVLTLEATFEGSQCTVTCRTIGGDVKCVVCVDENIELSELTSTIKEKADPFNEAKLQLALGDGQLLVGMVADGIKPSLTQIFPRPKGFDDILDEALWLGLINPTAARTMRDDVRLEKKTAEFYIEKWLPKIDDTRSANIKVKEALALQKNHPDDVRAVFKAWDSDGNGSISDEELRQALMALDLNLSIQQLRAAIIVADADQDGVVKYEEFLNWIFA